VKKAEPLRLALAGAREEALLAIALIGAAVAVAYAPVMAGPDLTAWVAMLAIQSVPYVCAVLVSLLAALPASARLIGNDYSEPEARPRPAAPAETRAMPLPVTVPVPRSSGQPDSRDQPAAVARMLSFADNGRIVPLPTRGYARGNPVWMAVSCRMREFCRPMRRAGPARSMCSSWAAAVAA
jgi:hypothetical protein